jgi:Flp pilus assembly protein TadD
MRALVAALAVSVLLPLSASAASNNETSQAAQFVRQGDYARARDVAAEGLRRDPRDARLQYLNALAHHLAAEAGDTKAFDLARVGYLAAAKFAPNDYWSHYMLGSLDFERGAWPEAQEQFAAAAMSQPDDWRALTALSAASYYGGDAGLARLAAERAAKLAPTQPETLRMAALTAAASGDAASAARYCSAYANANGGDAASLQTRTALLVRTAALDAPLTTAPAATAETPVVPEAALPNQMLAEVTIILSDNVKDTARGLNLLDGLRLQYGYDNTAIGNAITGGPDSFQRTITQKISVPQLDYNLNIFNRSGESYNVLARPTLTAYLSEESSFFVGQTVNLEASGINLGVIQPINAGVTLKLTPQSISGQTVKFRVDVSRSFFSNQRFGTFEKQLNTFKQQVAATAQLDFGQTLILSGLSETVYDGVRNETPILGEVPVFDMLFSRRTSRSKQTSVLILVTPLAPMVTTLDRRFDRTGMTKKIADLWTTLIDPSSDMAAVAARLSHAPVFTRAEEGDVRMRSAEDAALREQALASLLPK